MTTQTYSHDIDKQNTSSILVINSGSSTIKYQLLNTDQETVLLKGCVEGIGCSLGKHDYFWVDRSGQKHENLIALKKPDYAQSFSAIVEVLTESKCPSPIAIGHRVVHGGEDFIIPTLIDETVLAKIEQLSILAPLHNLANLQGIQVCLKLFPNVPQVAVFDTAFHQTLPDYAFRYAVPDSWYTEHKVRSFGFHGISHQYIANKAAKYLQKPLEKLKLITLHLGNGASIAAIEQGQCIDTSMGFTPLEGLIMGTRCGDIDPSIPLYMQQETNSSAKQISDKLNHHSGLLGISGNQDMRELLRCSEAGDRTSELALNMYCYRIKKYIGAYTAVLGHVDAIIFTGGVGENAMQIRSRCCHKLKNLGIAIDDDLNAQQLVDQVSLISLADQPVQVLVVRTNEELQIANDVTEILNLGKSVAHGLSS